jgi:hypothetical protein
MSPELHAFLDGTSQELPFEKFDELVSEVLRRVQGVARMQAQGPVLLRYRELVELSNGATAAAKKGRVRDASLLFREICDRVPD